MRKNKIILNKIRQKIKKIKNINLSVLFDGNNELIDSDSYENYVSTAINDSSQSITIYDD